MSASLTSFERAVIDAFLAGKDPTLAQLRAQAAICTVTGRKHTGVGSFTDIAVPSEAQRVSPPSLTFRDVDVQVSGVPNGLTALLFVRDGTISLLEFATYTGEWPTHPVATRIGYLRYVPRSANGFSLEPVARRDDDTLAFQLSGMWGGVA